MTIKELYDMVKPDLDEAKRDRPPVRRNCATAADVLAFAEESADHGYGIVLVSRDLFALLDPATPVPVRIVSDEFIQRGLALAFASAPAFEPLEDVLPMWRAR